MRKHVDPGARDVIVALDGVRNRRILNPLGRIDDIEQADNGEHQPASLVDLVRSDTVLLVDGYCAWRLCLVSDGPKKPEI